MKYKIKAWIRRTQLGALFGDDNMCKNLGWFEIGIIWWDPKITVPEGTYKGDGIYLYFWLPLYWGGYPY